MEKVLSTYSQNDLGLQYHPQLSQFKLWAPDAEAVQVNIYHSGIKNADDLLASYEMLPTENIWLAEVTEDLNGKFYTYEIQRANERVEVPDLYSKAVGLNGDRTAIIDLRATDPDNWQKDQRAPQESITDAFIWEVHVEDFSSDPRGGFQEAHRGKYLAFTEKNTTLDNAGHVPTGVNYLKKLGVNYVHLLPAFDSDNDELAQQYNWGYDPKNYNVPEGKYASDPLDPHARIREFKQMVQALHEEKIGVILDVVYNHTSLTEDSWFNLTVPDYYYRQDAVGNFADGSACGNEVASDRPMVRKYIVDSVVYWAEEYHLDGFRVDLMGLHDVETMNQIRTALNERGLEKVLMYGEPWDAGSNAIAFPELPANKQQLASLLPGIAVFNDDLRDAVKGYVFEEKEGGFVQGMNGRVFQHPEIQEKISDPLQTTIYQEHPFYDIDLAAAITANTRADLAAQGTWVNTNWAAKASQVIAYISAHDNLTLWDKLVGSTIQQPQLHDYQRHDRLLQMNKLAAAILFTSQGGIFMQAGEEMARTKYGDENSYRSPLAVNQINWENTVVFQELVAFYRGLWAIRQAYPPLRDTSAETAAAITFSKDHVENLIAYTIPNFNGGTWQQLAVILNSSDQEQQITLESCAPLPESWQILATNSQAGVHAQGTLHGNTQTIAPQSLFILGA